MTDYQELDGAVSNASNTVGIKPTSDFTKSDAIEWQTGIHPKLLLELAELVRFCYPDTDQLDVGFASSPETEVPALVVGEAGSDRVLMASPRLDCEAAKAGKEDTELGDYE